MEAPRHPGSGGEVRSWFSLLALTEWADVTLVSLGGAGGKDRVGRELAERCVRVVECVSTIVYVKSPGGWRIVVHHASPIAEAAEPAPPEVPGVLH